ncbi:MAG: EamA family transporter [Chitinophagaceae bacterium]|nr:EamA family transporter [Chitinophagaceae bacterium]
MGYKKLPFPTFSQLAWIVVMALLMFVFANGLSTWSLNYIPAGLSALIGALYPLSVVLIEMLFFKKKNGSVITFVGLFLGIAGIVIVFYEHAFQQHPPGFVFGVVLSVSAMLSWSMGTIFIAKNKLKINPYYAIGWQMFIAGILLFVFAKVTKPLIPFYAISLKVWLLIGYLVISGSIISFIAFIYSVKKLPTEVASLYAYINPLVAMVAAPIFIKNEQLTMYILWGAIVTLAGVFLVNYSIKRNAKKVIAEPEQ